MASSHRDAEGYAEAVLATLVASAAFVAYALTLYRTLPGGDSGELIGAVASGGVIHPPGYPLYSLLGSIFAHLPLAGLALRLNLMSAVCDAAAAGLLASSVSRATGSRPGGALAGLLFAFAPGVWRYAIAAEVFALNNLALALLVWLAVRYEASRDLKYALGGAFVLGLGLSNHQTILFTGIPIVAWAVWRSSGALARPATLGRLVMAGALGLLPYLYLPVAAARHAFVTWGAADTWDGFWIHVLRREYGTFQLAPTVVSKYVFAGDVLFAWGRHTLEQVGWLGVVLAAYGAAAALVVGWKKPRGLGTVLLVPPLLSVGIMMVLANLPVSQPLYRDIVARFWQQPDLYVCGFIGIAFASLTARASPAVTALLAGAASLVQLGAHYQALDHHDNHLVEDYGAEMLRAAPPGALLVSKGDLITNGLRYLQLAVHARPDVRVVDQELIGTMWGTPLFAARFPDVVFPGGRYSADPSRGFTLKQLFDANKSSPLYLCGGVAPGDTSIDGAYGLWPLGLCDEVHSGTEPVSLDDWLARSEEAVPRINFVGQAHAAGSWEDIVWGDTWEVRQSRGAHLMVVAGSDPGRRQYLPVAASILQKVVDENPDVSAHVYRNLAMAIGRAGITTPEQRAQAARAWEGYLKEAPPGDPQLPKIREELARLRQ
jgi:hypothetical protein